VSIQANKQNRELSCSDPQYRKWVLRHYPADMAAKITAVNWLKLTDIDAQIMLFADYIFFFFNEERDRRYPIICSIGVD
jgi:hypothetical protein